MEEFFMYAIRMFLVLVWFLIRWPVWLWRERNLWSGAEGLWKIFLIPMLSIAFLLVALCSAVWSSDIGGMYLLLGAALCYLTAGFLLWIVLSVVIITDAERDSC